MRTLQSEIREPGDREGTQRTKHLVRVLNLQLHAQVGHTGVSSVGGSDAIARAILKIQLLRAPLTCLFRSASSASVASWAASSSACSTAASKGPM